MPSTWPTARGGPGYFPVSIKVEDRAVLVVGGGRTALNEIRRLVDFGANVHVVSPDLVPEIKDLSVTHSHRVTVHPRKFGLEDEDQVAQRGYILVFACTGEDDLDEYVCKLANDAGVLVSQPLQPEVFSDGTFLVPAIRKRGHIKIAVSTDGFSPSLSKVLLEQIKTSLGGKLEKYVLFVESLREKLLKLSADGSGSEPDLKQIMKALSDSEELILAFQRENFEEALQLVDLIISELKEPTPL